MTKKPTHVRILEDKAYGTTAKAGDLLEVTQETIGGVIASATGTPSWGFCYGAEAVGKEYEFVYDNVAGRSEEEQDRLDELMTAAHKDSIDNPKLIAAHKANKDPMEHLLFSTLGEEARAMKNGASKYGRHNWRHTDVKASTYVAAIMRHLVYYARGEDIDTDSGLSHLAHIKANCAILMDAAAEDCLIDDRLTEVPEDDETA